jgi:hypothetical protein
MEISFVITVVGVAVLAMAVFSLSELDDSDLLNGNGRKSVRE